METSTRAVLCSYCQAIVIAAVTIVVGWLCGCGVGHYWSPAPALLISLLQAVAAGILLAATIGLVGWKIQTIGGKTFAENLNRRILRALYVLGTGLLVVTLAWNRE
jgi:uncharacterized membrane protein AbrB (regulator of aidB expression)